MHDSINANGWKLVPLKRFWVFLIVKSFTWTNYTNFRALIAYTSHEYLVSILMFHSLITRSSVKSVQLLWVCDNDGKLC